MEPSVTLSWEAHGDGAPIVCLPWFGVDRSVTAAAMEPALSGCTGWQRRYVDLPGCGESPAGPEDSDGVVDAIIDYVDTTLGDGRFVLAGCSYGGYLAAAVARRRPAQVAGLLLVCSGVKIVPADRDLPPGTAASTQKGWLDDTPPDLREHLSSAVGNRSREVAALISAVLTASSPGDEEYLYRLRATGYQLSDESSTARFDGPTSIVAGREDRVAGYADQFRALRAFPRGSYTVLADAGHYVPFEQPDAFRGVVREWLGRCSMK